MGRLGPKLCRALQSNQWCLHLDLGQECLCSSGAPASVFQVL